MKKFEIAGYDMPCVDLAVNVDVFPKPNGGTGINAMSWQGGGKVASGMVAAARLGAKCAMLGAVGSDDYGKFCIRDFERHGIDVTGMKVREGETTSLSIVLSDRETSGRSIVYRHGSAAPPSWEEMDGQILEECQWFFISHVTHVAMAAAKKAKQAGAKIIVDADSYSTEMMENIGMIDAFIASEFFYKVLFRGREENYEANCREVWEMGPPIVIFTLGAKGCVGYSREEGFFQMPSFPVEVQDTDVYKRQGVLSFLFLYLFFSMLRSIIARLRRYGEDMERIAVSDFGGELVVERQDEIGTIGDQFNQVLGRMRTLIRENIQKETAYKDAQLKALLLQINPHFIYNTLDMFAGKLTLDGEVETADYICDFAQLIRYNTMAATTSLPLDRELEHVKNYVNLQKCRYGDGVVLRIHASEELRQITIPRFLLQPIVENAFDHGFEGKAPEEERLIVISARKVGNRLILRVRDNGKGMSPQQVEEMNRKFSQPYDATALRHEKERGIGLENINDRLQIFSHSNDRLVLRSREGRYTSMFILQTLEGAAGSGEENETKD